MKIITFLPIIAACMGSGLARASVNQDTLLAEDFEANISSRWGSGSTQESGTRGSFIRIENTNASGSKLLTREIPASSISGRRIHLKADIAASGVSVKPSSYNGIKVMLKLKLAGGSYSYPQVDLGTGTFDWTQYQAGIEIPSGITDAWLQIGLENVTGTVKFDNLTIESDPLFLSESFNDTAVASRWSGSYSVVSAASGKAMCVQNSNAANEVMASRTLAIAGLRGHRVVLRAQVKAEDVSLPAGPLDGVKMMLRYQTPAGAQEERQVPLSPRSGTYGWKDCHMAAVIPEDAVEATLLLGLGKASGTVCFDNVTLEATPLFFGEDAEALPASLWQGDPLTTGTSPTGSSISFTNTTSFQTKLASTSVAATSLRGRAVLLSADVRAESISSGFEWKGIKVMSTCRTAAGAFTYPQLFPGTGTFDWKKVYSRIYLPDDVTDLSLNIGLQEASGTVWLDNIRIEALDRDMRGWSNPTAGHTIDGNGNRLRGFMVSTSIPTADIAVLQSWNVNQVRWQLGGTTHAAGLTLADYDTTLDAELAKLDARLEAFRTAGIRVILDLHSLSTHLFDNAATQTKIIGVWEKLALRYKDEPVICAYDLANEPQMTNAMRNTEILNWSELAEMITWAVRRIDPAKTIIIESEQSASVLAMPVLTPIRSGNIVYSIHVYDPIIFTHQGVGGYAETSTYPGNIGGTTYNKSKMAAILSPARAFQAKYGVHIYVGEFSAIRWADGGLDYLQHCIELFEEYGWDWSYHAFREWQGWSLEYDTDKTSAAPLTLTTSPRLAMVRSFLDLN